MIPSENLFPVNSSQVDWVFHRAFNAVGAGPEWLSRDSYIPMFGEPADLRHEIYASQFGQSEGLRYANQAHRRAMPHRSMCAYWAFNEAWPNAAYGTVVEFAGPLKMAYYAATKRPYAETDVSLKYDQLAYAAGSRLPASVWCVSEAVAPFMATVKATMVTTGGKVLAQRSWSVQVGGASHGPGTSLEIGNLEMDMPASSEATVVLIRLQLHAEAGHLELNAVSEEVYTFGVLPAKQAPGDWKHTPPPLLGLWTAPSVPVTLEVHRNDPGHLVATLTNPSSEPALYVELKALTNTIPPTWNEQFHPAVFSDNFIVLFGGEELSIDVELLTGFHASARAPDTLCAQGWNTPHVCAALPPASSSAQLFV